MMQTRINLKTRGGFVTKVIIFCASIILSLVVGLFNISYAVESAATTTATDTVNDEVVWSPQMRAEPKSQSLYSIKTAEVIHYLKNIVLFDKQEDYEKLPYIVGFDNYKNIAGSDEDIAYVMGFKSAEDIEIYTLINNGKYFHDPVTKKVIGYKTSIVGAAEIVEIGAPTTVLITSINRDIDPGTRLIPKVNLDLPEVIGASIPAKNMTGYIIEVENKNVGAGKNSAVVVNLGQADGVVIGNIFDLLEGPRQLDDIYSNNKISLPNKKFGQILVYKVMDKISLGIVVKTSRAVVVNDKIVSAMQGL